MSPAPELARRAAEMCRLGAELESLYAAAVSMYPPPAPPFALGSPSSADFDGEQRGVHELAQTIRRRMERRGCGRRGWISYRATLLAAAYYLENRW